MFWQRKNVETELRQGLENIFPRLWRYSLLLTGVPDQAADLAQSACLRAMEKSHTFRSGTDLDKWVFKIAKNLWLNELRSQAVRREGDIYAADIRQQLNESCSLDQTLASTQLINAVMALPEAQRATVGLVYIEGYSYREASDILDIPVGTVMSRLSAARAKLADKCASLKAGLS